MPRSYGIKGPKEGRGLLPWSRVQSGMQSARNYWVVTSSAERIPHAAPVWGLWHAGAFYFGTDPGFRKGRNMGSDRPVVVLEGRSERVSRRDLLKQPDHLYFEKYAFHLNEGVTYEVIPVKVLAWSEADFPGSAVVNASGTLDAEASGASHLNYVGNPTLGNVDTSGSSTVEER